MLHNILKAVDVNSQSEAYAVIVGMIDWLQAFDRQCHKLGIQSFIDIGVRKSLIPILINYFQSNESKMERAVQYDSNNEWWWSAGWTARNIRISITE